ncbi:MAG: ABC transporter ATP-binding protein/permease [Defluviitaleaceae bacterium]|nr:ABC transporter ATP-binding protein/permease [Defluviitaleaceae bacterium]
MKSKYGLWHVLRLVTPKLFFAGKIRFLILILLYLGCAGLLVGEVISQQLLFDAGAALYEGTVGLMTAFIALGVMAAVFITNKALTPISHYMSHFLINKMLGQEKSKIHKKISRLSPEVFEDTSSLDTINKAHEGCLNAGAMANMTIYMLTFHAAYFAMMSAYLFSLSPVLALSVIFIFIPMALGQVITAKIYIKQENAAAPIRREFDYYERCMTDREFFKETRILGGFSIFMDMFTNALKKMQKIQRISNRKDALVVTVTSLLTVIGYGGVLYLLLNAIIGGVIGIGAFAAVFASIFRIRDMMDGVINEFRFVSRSMGSVGNYLDFLALPEVKTSGKAKEAGDIELKDLCFRYPNAEAEAIKDISLTVKKGTTIAVVGENGSGKSTLMRLIIGLYHASSGEVLHGGVNIQDIPLSELYQRSTAVFQKYQRYQMLLSENISISDISTKANEEILDRVCEEAGVEPESNTFPDGYSTMLSREFDGVDLSGGQWQRISIARGLFRAHDMIVLDEPTAAIDPVEETRIYNRFAEIAKDKTAFIVTHRLGSVRLVDRILVLKNGRLVEDGNHDRLLAADGEYARLYKSQEQWYDNS